jgi:trimethylamine--corrinoid protein Co-methyltransferase
MGREIEMKPRHFEVLSPAEVQRIDSASVEVLETVGLRVDLKRARDAFGEAGAHVNEAARSVRVPERLVRWAVRQVPSRFAVYGVDADHRLEAGGGQTYFTGLGAVVNVIDIDTSELRPATLDDLRDHLRLVDGLPHISATPIGIWPSDIPMTTIHSEAILAWAQNCRKPFGMGAYGVLASGDMMEMMAIAVGGREEMVERPRFFGGCSAVSPLQMAKLQLEGLFQFVEHRQPVVIGPEAMAGATAPVTLAGLLAQHNAEVLAHVTLAQIIAPGTPVAYGCASTIADMATGNLAQGAVEAGLITAATAQLARHYGLPSRVLGGTTDAKTLDLQCVLERVATLMPPVLAGVDFVVCAGTLESITAESHALLALDDEIAGMLLRLARGIEVDESTLAFDLVKQVGWEGNYLAERHTAQNFRREHFLPKLLPRDVRQTWEQKGAKTTLDLARERARAILAKHEPRAFDPTVERELQAYATMVRQRTVADYYAAEWED